MKIRIKKSVIKFYLLTPHDSNLAPAAVGWRWQWTKLATTGHKEKQIFLHAALLSDVGYTLENVSKTELVHY